MPYAFNDDKSKFDITSQAVSRSNWLDSSSATFGAASAVAKAGNTVMFYIPFKDFTVPSNGQYVLGTVKMPYRPMINYAFAPIRSAVSPYLDVGTCYIKTDGTVTLYLPSGTYSSNLYISGTYICA